MNKPNTAYLIGVALGDGNLSNPNGRATRLRVFCDKKYPNIIERIKISMKTMLPDNSVNTSVRGNCVTVYCYSNKLETILGWNAMDGSKFAQKARVPPWIFESDIFMRRCLKGLIETDGSVFKDRGYTHVNFTTTIPELALDVENMIERLGYIHSIQRIDEGMPKKIKYVIRVCKRSKDFIDELDIDKS